MSKKNVNVNIEEAEVVEEAATEDAEQEEAESVEAEAARTDAGVECTELEAEAEDARAKIAEYLAGWQRERAEFANYRKRVERERTEIYQNAKLDVLGQFLTVFDDFERALANIPEEAGAEVSDWAQGVAMIHRKMRSIMDSLGVAEIEALGQPFDPNFHEAVGQGESEEYESDHVMDVLQKGYRHGDRVLRPAMVRVAI